MKIFICANCKKEFGGWSSYKAPLYCSLNCSIAARRKRHNMSREFKKELGWSSDKKKIE